MASTALSPQAAASMIVFGAGYGFDSLARASWLLNCHIHYWGDIDTHGFAILNSARTYLPHIQSLLMDEQTLLSHIDLSGNEESQHPADELRHLTAQEQSLYRNLKDHKWKKNLRLEQERIGWSYACGAIRQVLESIGTMALNRDSERLRLNLD